MGLRTVLFCMALVLGASIAWAQPPTLVQGQSFAWDYSDADVASGGVTRFELQIDGGGWVDVGMAAHTDPESYVTPIPALTTGSHSAEVRACNDQMCGDPSAPLSFVLAVKPATPANLRAVP